MTRPVRKARKTESLAAAFPGQREQGRRVWRGRAQAQAGGHRGAGRSGGDRQHLDRDDLLSQDGDSGPAGFQSRERSAGPGARRFRWAGADDELRPTRSPTTRARSKPGSGDRPCWRTSSSARRSPTSTTSGSPSGSCMRGARRPMATSSATSRWPSTRAPRSWRRRASAPPCSCGSRQSPASAARRTPRATSAASRRSSTPTRATSTSSATTSRSSSSRMR